MLTKQDLQWKAERIIAHLFKKYNVSFNVEITVKDRRCSSAIIEKHKITNKVLRRIVYLSDKYYYNENLSTFKATVIHEACHWIQYHQVGYFSHNNMFKNLEKKELYEFGMIPSNYQGNYWYKLTDLNNNILFDYYNKSYQRFTVEKRIQYINLNPK